MALPLFDNYILYKDTAQAIFHNRNTDGCVVSIRFCNQTSDSTRLALAITNTQSLPSDPAEYLDFGTVIGSNATYEITGVIVPAGYFVVAYSTRASVSVMCSGFALGSSGPVVPITTTSASNLTGLGLRYNYDPNVLFGLNHNDTSAVLVDVEKTTNMTASVPMTYLSGPKTYQYNGTTQWWISSDTDMPAVYGLQASAGFQWTLEAWFKFPVTPAGVRTGNQAWAICSKGGGIGGGETFTLFVGSATDTTYHAQVPYYCYVGIFGAKTQISPGPVNNNTWRQVAITWNGTTGNVWLNGSVGSALNVGGAVYQTNTWTIGSAGSGASTFAFEGEIGPIRVYNRALSAGEIANNWNNDRTRFGV